MPKSKATAMEKIPGMSKKGAAVLDRMGYKQPESLDGKDILAEWKKCEGKCKDDEERLLLLNSLRAVSDFRIRSGKDASQRKAFVRELIKLPGISELTAVALYEAGKTNAKTLTKELIKLNLDDTFNDIVERKHLSMLEATHIYFSLATAHYMANQGEKSKLALPGPWGKVDGP